MNNPNNPLLEVLAERQHDIWAHWMNYQFSQCYVSPDALSGGLVIPAELVERWKRQAATPYAELSEEEKESDRRVVRDHLGLQ